MCSKKYFIEPTRIARSETIFITIGLFVVHQLGLVGNVWTCMLISRLITDRFPFSWESTDDDTLNGASNIIHSVVNGWPAGGGWRL